MLTVVRSAILISLLLLANGLLGVSGIAAQPATPAPNILTMVSLPTPALVNSDPLQSWGTNWIDMAREDIANPGLVPAVHFGKRTTLGQVSPGAGNPTFTTVTIEFLALEEWDSATSQALWNQLQLNTITQYATEHLTIQPSPVATTPVQFLCTRQAIVYGYAPYSSKSRSFCETPSGAVVAVEIALNFPADCLVNGQMESLRFCGADASQMALRWVIERTPRLSQSSTSLRLLPEESVQARFYVSIKNEWSNIPPPTNRIWSSQDSSCAGTGQASQLRDGVPVTVQDEITGDTLFTGVVDHWWRTYNQTCNSNEIHIPSLPAGRSGYVFTFGTDNVFTVPGANLRQYQYYVELTLAPVV